MNNKRKSFCVRKFHYLVINPPAVASVKWINIVESSDHLIKNQETSILPFYVVSKLFKFWNMVWGFQFLGLLATWLEILMGWIYVLRNGEVIFLTKVIRQAISQHGCWIENIRFLRRSKSHSNFLFFHYSFNW